MANQNDRLNERGRYERDTEIESEHRRRDRAWSPTSRTQHRARDMYQDTNESRGFYDQPREQRLSGGMRSEEEFYASAGVGDRSAPSASSDHRGKGPKGYTRSDDRIREDVSDKFYDDGRLDASDIEVEVSQGVVALSGGVSDRESKRRAEDLAERCSGVRDVQNNLKVRRNDATRATAG